MVMKNNGYPVVSMIMFLILTIINCADYDLMEDPDRKPDRVELMITDVTDSSVTLEWTRCDDANFRSYEVYYGTDDIIDRSNTLADSLLFDVDTVKTVQPLDDLTHYYFRVIVTNENGNFSVSNIADTVTPEDMKGKLRLFPPESDKENNVSLRWTSALEEIKRYRIYGDTISTVDTADTLLSTVYSDTTEQIEGLLLDHIWRFRVYAIGDSGIISTSNIVDISLSSENQ